MIMRSLYCSLLLRGVKRGMAAVGQVKHQLDGFYPPRLLASQDLMRAGQLSSFQTLAAAFSSRMHVPAFRLGRSG